MYVFIILIYDLCSDAVSNSGYIMSNGGMINDDTLQRIWKETHEIPQSGHSLSRPRFEPSNSRIQLRSLTA
jgi:hypothetical protein